MVESYHEETKKRIGTDLSSFADPGSVRLGDGTRSEWRMRSEVREARFVVSPDHGINVFGVRNNRLTACSWRVRKWGTCAG